MMMMMIKSLTLIVTIYECLNSINCSRIEYDKFFVLDYSPFVLAIRTHYS